MELHATPNIITTEHKLLENIQNLLIEQNKLLKELVTVKPIETVNVVEGEIIQKVKIDSLNCTLCGGDHTNVGVRLSCAKKQSKLKKQ